MKCFKNILTVIAGLLIATGVFAAESETDKIEMEVRELKAKLLTLEDLSTTLAAEDKINQWLTISGYVQMSAGTETWDIDATIFNTPLDVPDAEGTWMDVGIVEFVFDFDFSDQLSASIHVTSEKGGFNLGSLGPIGPVTLPVILPGDEENYSASLSPLAIEEAWFKWSFASVEGLSLKAGLQDVTPGLEAAESVDLYGYSRSTGTYLGFLPNYVQGLTLAYEAEKYDVALTVANDMGLELLSGIIGGLSIGNNGNMDEMGYLIQGGVKLGENGKVHASFGTTEVDPGLTGPTFSIEYTFFDIWASYTIGQFEVAAEYANISLEADVTGSGGAELEADHFIVRGVWNINDKYSVGLRWDMIDGDISGSLLSPISIDLESQGIAIYGAVKVSENLTIQAEYGQREIEADASLILSELEIDQDWFVIEAFITF